MKNIFNTQTVSFQELLGNGKRYKVPDFQRDFSWNEENWEDLWHDMVALYEEQEPYHYMGNIVLQNTPESDKLFTIVDGQQRITTLSLFVLAVIYHLDRLTEEGIEPQANAERRRLIVEAYIGVKSISNLYYDSKLSLNENNNGFYTSKLLEFKKPLAYSKLRDSEKLLYNTYTYFCSQLAHYFTSMSGQQIASFLEKNVNKLIFIKITVDDDLSAYTVFETLNARGVELTTTDLLKNYIFSLIASQGKGGTFDIVKQDWQQIVDTTGLSQFPAFLRFYISSQGELVRKERLFKTLKRKINTSVEAIDLIDELKKTAYLYNAVLNPDDEFWNDHPKPSEIGDIRQSLFDLKLFGVRQPLPLLFAVYKHQIQFFSKILKWLVVVSFRYNVISKRNPNLMEKVYNKIASGLANGHIHSINEIKSHLKELYIEDSLFFDTFRTRQMVTNGKNKKIVKYILTALENQLSGSRESFEDKTFTIEHILPENYTEQAAESFAKEADNYVYRLGNYVLLEAKYNRQIGNKSFNEKSDVYKNSRFELAKIAAKYEDWNIKNINRFQSYMAQLAKTIWKI